MQRLEDTATPHAIAYAILWYSLCSSTLLLANKMAMVYLPFASVVSFIQIASSAVFIVAIKYCGVQVDNFEWDKVKAYSLYIVAFVAAIYSNMRALANSNVETVIVFRACSPISVSIIEYLFMDRDLPNIRSALSLLTVACGALLYCISDSQLALNGISAYTWVLIYFVMITFEMTYGKKLTSSVKMETVWGPVLYCNALAALPMFLIGYFNGDFVDISDTLQVIPSKGWLLLLFSCIAGTLIGFDIKLALLCFSDVCAGILDGCVGAWCQRRPTLSLAW